MKGLSFKRDYNGLQGEIHRFVSKVFVNQKKITNNDMSNTLYTTPQNQPSTFDGLLGKLIELICVNHYQKVYDIHESKYNIEQSYRIIYQESIIHQPIANNHNLSQLRLLLESLPKEYGTTYAMYTSGRNYNQIAMILNLPVETVEKRIEFVQFRLQQN